MRTTDRKLNMEVLNNHTEDCSKKADQMLAPEKVTPRKKKPQITNGLLDPSPSVQSQVDAKPKSLTNFTRRG